MMKYSVLMWYEALDEMEVSEWQQYGVSSSIEECVSMTEKLVAQYGCQTMIVNTEDYLKSFEDCEVT